MAVNVSCARIHGDLFETRCVSVWSRAWPWNMWLYLGSALSRMTARNDMRHRRKCRRPLANTLWLIIGPNEVGQTLRVQWKPGGHLVTPMVPCLTNEIQVKLCYQHAITNSTKSFAATTIRCRNIRRTVKVSKFCFCRFAVTTRETVWKLFCSHPVD